MLFGNDEDLELQPKRTKTLAISLGVHLALIVFLVFNPDLLTSPPKRIIKVMGQDYDLSKEELTELVVPPDALRPTSATAPAAGATDSAAPGCTASTAAPTAAAETATAAGGDQSGRCDQRGCAA